LNPHVALVPGDSFRKAAKDKTVWVTPASRGVNGKGLDNVLNPYVFVK
jgi:hypothetical protein